MSLQSAISRHYTAFLADLKARIAGARLGAARAVNRELVQLYWDIGRRIVVKQKALGWGDAVVEMLAKDLRVAFPGTTGFSQRNLWYMRRFYEACSAPDFLQQAAAELRAPRRKPNLQQPAAERPVGADRDSTPGLLPVVLLDVPWGHHMLLLDKAPGVEAHLFYLRATARFGWSRSVLLNQIKAGTYERAVTDKKTHNFPAVLPDGLAEQAVEALRSSYSLEFLDVRHKMKERELEERLIDRLRDFILELGYGFCFIGRQYRLALGKKEYAVDLLFYHRFLKALVAFDLKVGAFEPEHAGKMDFYLNVLNDKERAGDDNPSIGIILCAEKEDVEVEYALKTKLNPIGVAVYHLRSQLPRALKGKLPTTEQLSEAVRAALPKKGRR